MTLSQKVRQKAFDLGFDLCGIAACSVLEQPRERFERWLAEGCHGGLDYLTRNREKRFDPQALHPGAASMLVCGLSYHRPPSTHPVASRIATYALYQDYHQCLKQGLHALASYLQIQVPEATGRCFTDSAPVAEKSWAQQAGLGWIGRNTLLIHPQRGSFLLLGEILTSVPLEPDAPYTADGCGNCRRCIEACPVGALRDDRTLDARRCLARLTIEPGAETQVDLHGHLFGCDRCQQVCPHNRKAPMGDSPLLPPLPATEQLTVAEWLALSESEFQLRFAQSPLRRCGREALQERIARLFPSVSSSPVEHPEK